MSELTGRRRYKLTEEGLILQVERSRWNGEAWKCGWEDATASDVMAWELA